MIAPAAANGATGPFHGAARTRAPRASRARAYNRSLSESSGQRWQVTSTISTIRTPAEVCRKLRARAVSFSHRSGRGPAMSLRPPSRTFGGGRWHGSNPLQRYGSAVRGTVAAFPNVGLLSATTDRCGDRDSSACLYQAVSLYERGAGIVDLHHLPLRYRFGRCCSHPRRWAVRLPGLLRSGDRKRAPDAEGAPP